MNVQKLITDVQKLEADVVALLPVLQGLVPTAELIVADVKAIIADFENKLTEVKEGKLEASAIDWQGIISKLVANLPTILQIISIFIKV